jgi:hypothetical protein
MSQGWLDQGKSVGYLTTVLQFKADGKYTVRLLDDAPPLQVWRHACRDSFGKFLKALCIGDRNGCKLCKANEPQRAVGIKPKDQYHPKASEYVKAVWVYEEKRPMLIVGNDIWRQLDVMVANGVCLTDRDFSIVRTDKNKQVSYQVIALGPSPFQATVDATTIPSVESYVKYLETNIDKVPVLGNGETPVAPAKTGGDPVPSFLTAQPPAPAPAQAPTSATTDDRKKLMDELSLTITKPFNSAAVAACQAKVLEARKAINPNCSTSVDFDKMNDGEIRAFIDLYKKEVKIQ